MSSSDEDFLNLVYAATDPEELRVAYRRWAASYDVDVMRMGYQSPGLVVGLLARHAPREARVLDCGAGTGLVGLLMAGLGYQNITALDMSEDMLAVAHARGCYTDSVRAQLGEPIPLADGCIDAIVASGVFTTGHAPPEALDELVRLLAPGGVFVVSERLDGNANAAYAARRDALQDAGLWKFEDESADYNVFPLDPAEAHLRHRVFVYKRT